jgi:hypothetical protein
MRRVSNGLLFFDRGAIDEKDLFKEKNLRYYNLA